METTIIKENEQVEVEKINRLTVGPDETISTGQAALLGIQHVLAMDVYVVPFIIATIAGFNAKDTSMLIQATFLAAGIGTIIQTHFFMKMPVAQGPSFIPIGAVAGIYLANGGGSVGWGTVMGASLVGAVLLVLLGFTGVFNYLIKKLVPQLVGGTIIFIVGLSLMPSALNDNVFHGAGATTTQNIIMASISAGLLIACVMFAAVFPKQGKVVKIASVIIALVGGCIAANMMGLMDWTNVQEAKWFSMVQLPIVDIQYQFHLPAILTMAIIYLVLMAETTGTWFAVSNVCEQELTDTQLKRGVLGEGLGCFVAALIGATPVTGYSTNAGIISITGVASRKVFVSAGIWFVVFGFSSKLSALISAIPSAVIGGVFAVVCGIIAMSGLRVIKEIDLGEKETYVIVVPLILTLALLFLPEEYLTTLPQFLQYLFSSPIATASLAAICLNKLLPEERTAASLNV